MAIRNNGALRILTKDKESIISVDPKDISACECCVYTYPRNQSFRDTEHSSRILLGEYEDAVYAKEVISLIFAALTKEAGVFEMPDETELDEYEETLHKKVCTGIDDAIQGNTDYKTNTGVDAYGNPYVYTEGAMTVLDGKSEVYLTIRNPGAHHEFDCTVSKTRKRAQKTYHSLHELFIERYGCFLASMYKESEKRNEAATRANKTPTGHKGE